MIKEISKHIRTRQIVVRKDHSAFRGANYCAQIVRRIKNATSYLIQHNPVDNKKIMSHSDADKWLKKNNSELYTKLPSAIAQHTGFWPRMDVFFKALRVFQKSPSKFKAKPKKPRYVNSAATVYIGRNGFKLENGTLFFAYHIIPPSKPNSIFHKTGMRKVLTPLSVKFDWFQKEIALS